MKLIFFFILCSIYLSAQSVQSSARPFGLDIVAPVQLSGSDEASEVFQSKYLPSLQEFANVRLGERVAISDASSIALDPSKLKLGHDADVRVYFISEGAGFHNTLGFSTEGGGINESSKLIFPDASMGSKRTSFNPLQSGDFVDLGTVDKGTQLDFFVIANGAQGGTNTFSTQLAFNPDNIVHAVAFAIPGSPYLLIGFEDLFGGGDQDYNDLIFTIDIGVKNVAKLVGAPEPQAILSLIAMLCVVFFVQKKKSCATHD